MKKAALIVRNPSGDILYDTSKSIYGLIKSGPVEFHGYWSRANQPIYTDTIYKFTVDNAISPIVFTVGNCAKPTESKEGNKHVFYFAGPVSGIKVYCFDIMAPIFKGAGLKTRAEDSSFTFNSLQRPLNVIGTSTAPPPARPWDDKNPTSPFGGGGTFVGQYESRGSPWIAGWHAWYINIQLDPSIEYAAHIPWSRGCFSATGNFNDLYPTMSGEEEGCTGYMGGVTHLFWAAPESSYMRVHSSTRTGIYSLSYEPRPACMYIDTSKYPYPFDPPR